MWPPYASPNKPSIPPTLKLTVGIQVIILAASFLGCAFPVVAKRAKGLRIPPTVFFCCKHFGTGVLVATAFIHVSSHPRYIYKHYTITVRLTSFQLLPTAFGNLNNPCLPDFFTDQFPPFPGLLMMVAMFLFFVIEMWLNAKTGGHSHGGPTGEAAPPGSNGHGHGHGHAQGNKMQQHSPVLKEKANPNESVVVGGLERQNSSATTLQDTAVESVGKTSKEGVYTCYDDFSKEMDYKKYKKMETNIALLECGILFHSIFVGLTLSITVKGFAILLIAFTFHQCFEGLGLGSRIASVPFPASSIRPWILVGAFSLTAPAGLAIGLGIHKSYDPESSTGLIVVGIFNAVSAGLLIYAALVDLLAEDFLSEEADLLMSGKKKAFAFCFVLFGGENSTPLPRVTTQ